jgi:hypothetical protein
MSLSVWFLNLAILAVVPLGVLAATQVRVYYDDQAGSAASAGVATGPDYEVTAA